ncbi:Putative ribonuclease H protein At1g65750 [Linum perenne]
MGYEECIRFDAVGFSGGIWVMWRPSDVKLVRIASNSQYIHLQGACGACDSFFLTIVYGKTSVGEREALWAGLRNAAQAVTGPWLVAGDFNALLSSQDKRGGNPFCLRKHQPFIDVVADCGLMDAGFKGPRFTWKWGSVLERLDRALINADWMITFPKFSVQHLVKVKSDHRPLLLIMNERSINPLPRPFRFLAAWHSHADFGRLLNEKWERGVDLPFQLANITPVLQKWNKETFGNIMSRKKELIDELQRVEVAADYSSNNDIAGQELDLRNKLEEVLWIRSFIWGAKLGERKLHLVNWDTVCQPKREGGLGIRSARELNGAYMMKLAWILLKHPNELWVQVIMSKYLKKVNGTFVARGSRRLSPLWRGIREAWEPMNKGIQWGVNNGKDTCFWCDRWLDCGVLLRDHAFSSERGRGTEKVADFSIPSGGWDMGKLSLAIPLDLVKEVVGMSPPSPELGQDVPVWGLEANGMFSIKSAYALLKSFSGEDRNRVWKLAWSWPGPNPSIWRSLWPSDLVGRFFGEPIVRWWELNLANKENNLLFGITVWCLWKSRNELIFQNKQDEPQTVRARVNFWRAVVIRSWSDAMNCRGPIASSRSVVDVGWKPALEGWETLNSDGSVIRNPTSAAAGWVIRNMVGRVLVAGAINLGRCSITRAEMKGVIEGMQAPWELGVRRLEVQMDSSAVMGMLLDGNLNNQHASLISRFQRLRGRDWELRFIHVYREANHLADCLANKGHQLQLGVRSMLADDTEVRRWEGINSKGVTEQRWVRGVS